MKHKGGFTVKKHLLRGSALAAVALLACVAVGAAGAAHKASTQVWMRTAGSP